MGMLYVSVRPINAIVYKYANYPIITICLIRPNMIYTNNLTWPETKW